MMRMTNRPKQKVFLIIILFLLLLSDIKNAEAQSGGAMINSLPSNLIFPVPTGILFPSFACAGGVNPAALSAAGKVASIQGSYTPGGGAYPKEFFGSLAAGSQKMGIGLGYLGESINGKLTSNAFIGAGFKIDPVNIGIGLRDFDISNKSTPNVDLGLISGEGNGGGGGGLRFGFVVYNLNSPAQLDLGVGFSGGKKYNMEINVLLPPFSGGTGSGNVVTVSGTVFAADIIGLTFRTSYFTKPNTYEHTMGLSGWLSEAFNLFAQFSTPRVWTGGLMVTF